jgi:hypothetical protein
MTFNILLGFEYFSAGVASEVARILYHQRLVLFVVTENEIPTENSFDVHHEMRATAELSVAQGKTAVITVKFSL